MAATNEAAEAWALLSQQPITEASSVKWYVGAQATAKKRASAASPAAKPLAKRQALQPTQGAPLGKGKRKSLLMAGSSVMDAADFAALSPSVATPGSPAALPYSPPYMPRTLFPR
ncbi:hypothetical protein M885DRAFT_560844 [Pelagophyceae sp. CCMP2097]|nr:hypothetical protein M885DRAFT_560844 [Pelagophyceae sp. CCMP2097]